MKKAKIKFQKLQNSEIETSIYTINNNYNEEKNTHFTYLTKIHNYRFVNFLPQVSSENLNKRDFQSRDFTVHENARQIKLYLKIVQIIIYHDFGRDMDNEQNYVITMKIKTNLETDVHISPVYSRRPPQSKPSVGNLVQTRTLGICQFFVLHRFFEPRCFLPKRIIEINNIKKFH